MLRERATKHFVAAPASEPEHASASDLVHRPRASVNRDRGGSRAHQGGTGQVYLRRIRRCRAASPFCDHPHARARARERFGPGSEAAGKSESCSWGVAAEPGWCWAVIRRRILLRCNLQPFCDHPRASHKTRWLERSTSADAAWAEACFPRGPSRRRRTQREHDSRVSQIQR